MAKLLHMAPVGWIGIKIRVEVAVAAIHLSRVVSDIIFKQSRIFGEPRIAVQRWEFAFECAKCVVCVAGAGSDNSPNRPPRHAAPRPATLCQSLRACAIGNAERSVLRIRYFTKRTRIYTGVHMCECGKRGEGGGEQCAAK